MLKGDERQRADNAFSDFRCGLIGPQRLEENLRAIHSAYELTITTQKTALTDMQTKLNEANKNVCHCSTGVQEHSAVMDAIAGRG